MRRLAGTTLVLLVVLLAAASPSALAQALAAPSATTGGVTDIERTTATLTGTVDPNGVPTTYFFEYGTSTSYGSRTAVTNAGAGDNAISVRVQASGLSAGTTYNVRLVAQSAGGTVRGANRTFTTDKPAAVQAPTVTTGAVRSLGQSTVTLTGSSNPRGSATKVFFEYGTAKSYGARTPDQDIGSGTSTRSFSAAVVALAPNTTYNYRAVAVGPGGTARGANKTFKTAKVPNTVTLLPSTTILRAGSTVVLGGALTGTGNAGVRVQLQVRGFPFTSGFVNLGNAQVTAADGRFGFTVSPVLATSQFRVVAATSPQTVSPVVTVGARLRVSLSLSDATPRRGRRVLFSGSVRPNHPAGSVSIQKRKGDRWVVVARTTLRDKGDRSVFSRRITITRDGTYRVSVRSGDGDHLAGRSLPRRIRVS